MSRFVIALDPSVGVDAQDLAVAWDSTEEARAIGMASTGDFTREDFLPDPVALVVIPLLVNVASSAAYDLTRRLVNKLRKPPPGEPDLEFVQVTSGNGDQIVVIRLRRSDT